VYNQFHGSYGTVSEEDKTAMRLNGPHDIDDNVTTHSAAVAYDRVLTFAGASLVRDAVDVRIIDNVSKGEFSFPGSNGSTNGIIDTQADVGGWPELNSTTPPVDSSGDGIPDEWQSMKKLDPTKHQANGHELSSGYDNLEVYLNSLVETITQQQVNP
jgi:hypothetical protein